ncbi:MAG: hypothetical protein L6Q83_02910, partial [Gammaproteobacteria bacterium]|nr:hypothetical protein [Gammaproteobacteria bacterium]
VEVPGPDGAPTMETPTIESPELSSTMETPTIQTRAAGRTMETPTIEAPGIGGTARLQGLSSGDEPHDQTAEIDLEDLGLDLAGLDEAARDMATGLHEAMPEESADLDFDLSEAVAPEGEDSTAEMEKGEGLSHLTNAFSKSEAASRSTATPEDTVEQPRAGAPGDDTVMSATSGDLLALNLDLAPGAGAGEDDQLDLTSTSMRPVGLRGPGDATMTEVGTKLDLARAYIDMGDPDGARSILNEVVEEGDLDQQQEARQLLDDLDG